MLSTNSLIKKLKNDYPQFSFIKNDLCYWSSQDNTIFFNKKDQPEYILHELAHALLNHISYNYDIELIAMERDAWEKAKKLSEKYSILIDEKLVQKNLDTYRDWLHARSTCKKCQSIGVQTSKNTYKCVACGACWRVNDARQHALRRYDA